MDSLYKPSPIGPVKLTTKSALRARLTAGGTYFRSKESGEQSNLLQIGVYTDGNEGVCVIQNSVLSPNEQISVTGMGIPNLELHKLSLNWNEEIKIASVNGEWRAQIQGIRWQIAPGAVQFVPIQLGPVSDGLFSGTGVSFKITGLSSWPTNAVVYLRPRTRRYTLVPLSVTDPDTMLSTTGWDIQVLRGHLNGDASGWITMPTRAPAPTVPPTDPAPHGEDIQDLGYDAPLLTPFIMENMIGGDGLPTVPVGLNTGPTRVLVHLNYSEKDDGSMGELNQVFEWIGTAANVGSWQRY